ncbi:TIGR00267 family protein [Methanococcus aeolicus]|uniref:TIGR00267 family protein n=1 Tax=Methanococcus aeolicus TaxID=42879 RepID=UPI0021C7E823|nr:TIGR00267 family protein [Methanococcus aeolicus]UXM84683.1 TIGR00267 family protein [Methanococcus aeolicus]
MSLKGILSHIKVENLDVRYIIRGIIDGSLSSLGVVIGASGGDISIIIAAGVGGGVANGISNILGALTAERAILEGERASQEKVLLQNEGSLKKSSFYQMAIDKTAVSGMQDGLATALGSIIPVMPFLFLEKNMAIMVSIAITLAILFALGVFIGKISKENLKIYGLKMVIGGVMVAIISFAIERFI